MSVSRCVWIAALGLCVFCQNSAVGARDISNRNDALPADGQLEAIVDRLTTLDRRVEELQDQNRHLMNQLLQLSSNQGIIKVLQDLQGVCEELTAAKAGQTTRHGPSQTTRHGPSQTSTEASPTTASSARCPQQPAASQFHITAVMKEETDALYKVTVCYVSPEKPEVSYRIERNTEEEEIEHHDFGVVTIERTKPQNNESAYLGLGFTLKSTYHVYMSLQLAKDSPDNVLLPTFQVEVEPGNEINYNSKSDVDITFNVINEAGGGSVHNMMNLYLKSNTERNIVDEFSFMPNIEMPEEISDVQLTQTNHSNDNMTQLLHMPYSPQRTGGYAAFQLINHSDCSQGCLVESMVVVQVVVFYPEGQTGPFPEHFVGFVETKRPGARKREESKCYEDNRVSNCVLYCAAAGDDPTVTLTRADHSPVSPHSDMIHDDTEFFASWFREIHNPTPEDAGEYLCQARAADGGHVITKTITLSVDRVAEIVFTDVETFPDGSLEAVCKADGIPPPSIHFGPYYASNDTALFNEAVVTPKKLNDTMSQATLFLPNWEKFHRNELDEIYCYAENVEYQRDMKHMPVDWDM